MTCTYIISTVFRNYLRGYLLVVASKPHEEGMAAGLRLTRTGSITTCAYAVDTDGRTVFNQAGWKKFLHGKNLRVRQGILLTIANIRRRDLRMMITINLI